MSILTFLFILLAIWIVPKLVRGYLFVHRIKKQTRAMYEQMYNAQNPGREPESEPRRRKGGWSAPMRRRKKIDPAVGEYVKFQEITVTETATGSTSQPHETTYTVEQQVTDAEWEDIK